MISEHDAEPVAGLPATLPRGETCLLQCRPRPWAFAKQTLHIPVVAVYFAVLAAWRASEAFALGGAAAAAAAVVLPLGLGLATVLILAVIGWWMATSTIYTITSRRVVLRIGAALPLMVNIPFKVIESASVKPGRDGSGNVALVTARGARLSWLALWPHVRAWRFAYPQATLRALPDVERVVAVLSRGLDEFQRAGTVEDEQGGFEAEPMPLARVSSA